MRAEAVKGFGDGLGAAQSLCRQKAEDADKQLVWEQGQHTQTYNGSVSHEEEGLCAVRAPDGGLPVLKVLPTCVTAR